MECKIVIKNLSERTDFFNLRILVVIASYDVMLKTHQKEV